jgi:hypothetical protein
MRQLKQSALPPNTAVITVATNATGGAAISTLIDGVFSTHAVAGAETPTVAAAALVVAMLVAMGTTYTITSVAGVITVVGPSASPLVVSAVFSTDATMTFVATTSYSDATALMLAQTVVATGRPFSPLNGFAVPGTENTAQPIFIRATLTNFAGAAKTARWRLWQYDSARGWVLNEAVGVRTISDAGAAVITETSLALDLEINAQRIAIELVDDGAAGNLATCGLSAWVAIKG